MDAAAAMPTMPATLGGASPAPGGAPGAELPGTIEPEEWTELSYRLKLTDGLPTFAPHRMIVDALIAATGRSAHDELGLIPPRNAVATIEAVAANAAMAGCLPEHMPAVVAAIDAMLDERFNLRGVACTTHGCWPLVIVSGPAVRLLGMATTESVFSGGGARANLAIGRAVKLVMWNLGGAHPGVDVDNPVKEVFGHPGRLAFCIAEEPDNTPWPSMAAAGHDRSAVTVFACESPQSVSFWGVGDDPEQRLGQVADHLAGLGNNNAHTMGEALVVFSPSEARHLARCGHDRASVQKTLFRLGRRRLGDLRPRSPRRPDNDPRWWYEWWPDWVDQSSDDTLVPCVERPESIHVMVSGADSIPWAVVCPGWGHLGGYAVTREIEDP